MLGEPLVKRAPPERAELYENDDICMAEKVRPLICGVFLLMFVCMCVCAYVCMYACMCACV